MTAARQGATVRCTDGREIRLGPLVGQGGQGSVHEVADHPELCVKIYKGARSPDALRARLRRLQALQATDSLVLPRHVLETPDLGYVMERVRGMLPLGDLCTGQAPIAEWYARTGGLRRRLLLGIRLAWAFQDLHARGLAYCDLSFDNVLVTLDGAPRVRLIDCDNLTVQGAPPPAIEGTPWFIAPEVLADTHRPDATTDAWSLAVLLYHALVLTHPLLGDEVRASAPDVEEAALRGRALGGQRLPWVDHPDERCNATRLGLPRALVLSRSLRELFHRAFGEGLVDRHARPAEGRWAETLATAADATLSCQGCGNTSYLSLRSRACPWCDAPLALPGLVVIAGRRPLVIEIRRYLYPRHLQFRQATPYEEPLAEIGYVDQDLVVTCKTDLGVEVRPPGAGPRRLRPGGRAVLARGATFQLPGDNPVAEVHRA